MRIRRLFVYGTLRDPELRARLLGKNAARLRVTPAELPGMRLLRSPRGDWPVLGRKRFGRVEGLLLERFSAQDLRRLGRYEENEYRLYRLRVITQRERRVWAFAYLPRRRPRAGSSWNFE